MVFHSGLKRFLLKWSAWRSGMSLASNDMKLVALTACDPGERKEAVQATVAQGGEGR
jgi:hypothetical protein